VRATKPETKQEKKEEDSIMARLRNHETYGKSIKCATISPYRKDEGPSFTVHLFNTGKTEDGLQVLAYELWQRDPNGVRHGLFTGEDFLSADPESDSALYTLIQKFTTPIVLEKPDALLETFYSEHANVVLEEAKERFAPRTPKRSRKAEAASQGETHSISKDTVTEETDEQAAPKAAPVVTEATNVAQV
jgi:hypothetical protein